VARDGTVPDGFEAQARLVWTNLRSQLAAAGLGVHNLVKVTTFLASRDQADLNGAIRREFLGTHTPALTVIVAEIFDPRWLLEIEAVAAAPHATLPR
jgi:2-iminobutanoate/2-iminopropanoate deaminase